MCHGRSSPGQFRDALATQLMNRSMALLAARRHGEALASAEQSVAIFRSLAAARPGQPLPGLAFALNNLSYPLRAAGHQEEALAAAMEATGLYRALAKGSPRKYRYSLANSLGTQAELLAAAGRTSLALAVASEAADLYQGMRPAHRSASGATQVLFLHGQLLCEASRHREAARSLARAWHLAAAPPGPNLPSTVQCSGPPITLTRRHSSLPGTP
jgi:tetratricopeptide (TPR) repeat protein